MEGRPMKTRAGERVMTEPCVVARREFIRTGAAFAGLASCGFDVVARTCAAPNLRLGILADTHIRLHPAAVAWARKFESALRRFDAENVDAVLVAGDLTDFGLVPELKVFADIWYKVFPDDRRSDGAHVEKLFIYGDHDTQEIYKRLKPGLNGYPFSAEEIAKMAIVNNDRAALWKEMFHEDWAPVVKKTVNGYDFVLVHHAWGEPDNKWGSRAPAMKPFYDGYRPDPSRPFFHVQHRVCKGTSYMTGRANTDDGFSTEILSRFGNCFAFCGHAHKAFISDKVLWQGAYSCLALPSLAYATIPAVGHENGYLNEEQKGAGYVPQMTSFDGLALTTQQGMTADIYDDRIVLHRIDFESPEPGFWGPDWVVPLPLGREKPFDFAAREKMLPVPQFPDGAKMTISSGTWKNRGNEDVEQVTVSFPAVLASNAGVRAFDYEVTAFNAKKEKLVKRVLSPRFWRAECAEPKEAKCVFAKAELPKDTVRFAARPANCFGRHGKPIESGMSRLHF